MGALRNGFLILFIFLLGSNSLFSQQSDSILIPLDNDLREGLYYSNDSVWLNSQLVLQNSIFKIENIKYRLMAIEKRPFWEGPREDLCSQKDSIETSFGDQIYYVLGEKIYTYVGNHSRGFYYKYKMQRVHVASKLEILDFVVGYCEHGFDQERGQACYQCLHEYRLRNDSTYNGTLLDLRVIPEQ